MLRRRRVRVFRSGVAVLDCDEDGLSDMYGGGANPSELYHNDSPVGGASIRAVVGRAFQQSHRSDGGLPAGHRQRRSRRSGRAPIRGRRLAPRPGDCTFERANETWSFDAGDDWTVGFSATWEGDGAMPTLAFGNYLAENGQLSGTRRPLSVPPGWRSIFRAGCPPQAGAPCRFCSATGTVWSSWICA